MDGVKILKWRWAPVIIVALVGVGCAYTLGGSPRNLPGNFRLMTVPIFKNQSPEPDIEVYFSNALITEFSRSHIARVVEKNQAEVSLEGTIVKVLYKPVGQIAHVGSADNPASQTLPQGTILASAYDIEVLVSLNLRKISDNSSLWKGEVVRTRSYAAPQVKYPGINSVDPLYNLSARRQNFRVLAQDMMVEAHNRLTENF